MNRQEANETLYANLEKMDLREMGIEADEIAEAVEVLKAPDWISVKDRLPEPWVTVLLWDGDEMVSGYADDDGDLIEHRWGQVFRATHWMLPEPPGGEGER